MKFLIFSDLHIHKYKNHNESKNSRFYDCLRVLEDVFIIASVRGIDVILFCGDLFDSPKELDTEVINHTFKAFKNLFYRFSHIGFISISGNHDINSKSILAERYKEQLNFYKMAIEKMTNRTVKEKYLYLFSIDEAVEVE